MVECAKRAFCRSSPPGGFDDHRHEFAWVWIFVGEPSSLWWIFLSFRMKVVFVLRSDTGKREMIELASESTLNLKWTRSELDRVVSRYLKRYKFVDLTGHRIFTFNWIRIANILWTILKIIVVQPERSSNILSLQSQCISFATKLFFKREKRNVRS